MPFGPRKSGIPDSVEIPAPVSTVTRPARTQPATSSINASSTRQTVTGLNTLVEPPGGCPAGLPGTAEPDDSLARCYEKVIPPPRTTRHNERNQQAPPGRRMFGSTRPVRYAAITAAPVLAVGGAAIGGAQALLTDSSHKASAP